MSRFIRISHWLVVSAILLTLAIRPQAQVALSSATPLAETENLGAYPAPPEGFNVARANIPQGELKVVEYDSKTLGLRRLLRVYTPAGYSGERKYPVLYLHHGLGNTSTEWTQRARAPTSGTARRNEFGSPRHAITVAIGTSARSETTWIAPAPGAAGNSC